MKTVLSTIFCIGPTLLATPCVSQTVSEEMEITTIQQQAIEGDKEAQFRLAECYRIGKEIKQDWELAYQW